MSISTDTAPLRLRQGELGLGHIIAATLANIAPAMSFYFSFAIIVVGAGVAAPLTILAAMIAVLFLANTLAEFSRFTPSAGSFVTFIGKGFGPTAAVTAAVFLIFGYILAGSAVVAIMGGWTADTLSKYLGINIPWEILTLAAIVLIGAMTVRGGGCSRSTDYSCRYDRCIVSCQFYVRFVRCDHKTCVNIFSKLFFYVINNFFLFMTCIHHSYSTIEI